MYRELYGLYRQALGTHFLRAHNWPQYRNRGIERPVQRLPEDLHECHYKRKDSQAKGRPLDAAGLLFLHTVKTKGQSILGGRRFVLFESGQIGIVFEKSEQGIFGQRSIITGTRKIMTTPSVLNLSSFFA